MIKTEKYFFIHGFLSLNYYNKQICIDISYSIEGKKINTDTLPDSALPASSWY